MRIIYTPYHDDGHYVTAHVEGYPGLRGEGETFREAVEDLAVVLAEVIDIGNKGGFDRSRACRSCWRVRNVWRRWK